MRGVVGVAAVIGIVIVAAAGILGLLLPFVIVPVLDRAEARRRARVEAAERCRCGRGWHIDGLYLDCTRYRPRGQR